MRVVYLLPALSLIFLQGGFNAFAQEGKGTKPDLSGTWKLDAGATFGFSESLIVLRKDAEFTITSEVTDSLGAKSSESIVYYADGRGETNEFVLPSSRPWRMDKTKVKTKTKWKGEKLVSSGSFEEAGGSRSTPSEITEQWELSEGGQVLLRKIKVQAGVIIFRSSSGIAENTRPLPRPPRDVFHQSPAVETVLTYRRVN